MEPVTDLEKSRASNDRKVDTDWSQSDKSSNTTVAPASDDAEKPAQADIKPDEPPEQETRKVEGWKWVVVVLAIYSSQFLFALDQTIVAYVQPAIVGQFNAVDRVSWLSVAFPIGAAGTNLIWYGAKFILNPISNGLTLPRYWFLKWARPFAALPRIWTP